MWPLQVFNITCKLHRLYKTGKLCWAKAVAAPVAAVRFRADGGRYELCSCALHFKEEADCCCSNRCARLFLSM